MGRRVAIDPDHRHASRSQLGARGAAHRAQPNHDHIRLTNLVMIAPQVPTFQLQFPPQEIEGLAVRSGYVDDPRRLGLGAAARARGFYTREEFIAVCAWKTARSRPKVAANSEAAVVDATRRALAADDEETRIRALLELS